MSDGPGDPRGDGARWSRWRHAYTDDYDRLTDPVAVASNRAGVITAEQRLWYSADRIRSRVRDAVWLGGVALVVACAALGWLDRRLLGPLALLGLIYGVRVIRRLRSDPLADDLNAGSVASVSGGVEALKDRPGRGAYVYRLGVRRLDTPYEGYRRFRIGRQVYDRLPHPTDAERRLIGPHRGLYTPSVTCRAYCLPRSSLLLSIDLTDAGQVG